MGTEAPGTVGDLTGVPIRIENNSGLSILSGDDLTVDLQVEGKRSVINKTGTSDIDVSVVIDKNTQPGRYSYDLNIQLPAGLRLIESSLTKIMLYLDNTTSVSVPVRVKLTEYILQDQYEIGIDDITTGVRSVRVTGPESLLETIECAQVTLSLGNVTRSVTCIGSLTLVDQNGDPISSSYVRMAQSEVTVTIPVYKYYTLPLEIKYRHGFFNENNVSVQINPAAITVRGEVDTIDALKWEYTLDEKTIKGNGSYTVPIALPSGIVNVDNVPTAEISVTHIGTMARSLTISGFQVNNTGGRTYEMVTQSLMITVRGSEELIPYLSAAAVTAVIDLGGQPSTGGTITVPVTFRFLGAYDGQVYEIGTYFATLRITS
jgi:YbbR domain-containing protein